MMADGEQIHSPMYPGSILGDRLSEQTEVNIRQHALEAACFVVCATAWLGPDMNSSWLFFAVAFLVGALITVQTDSNARLKEAFGEALPAVIVSSSLGVILLIAVTLRARTPWPSLSSLAVAPWWGWLGGALGAAYAVATVLLARESARRRTRPNFALRLHSSRTFDDVKKHGPVC